jgi:hypothetical protein
MSASDFVAPADCWGRFGASPLCLALSVIVQQGLRERSVRAVDSSESGERGAALLLTAAANGRGSNQHRKVNGTSNSLAHSGASTPPPRCRMSARRPVPAGRPDSVCERQPGSSLSKGTTTAVPTAAT